LCCHLLLPLLLLMVGVLVQLVVVLRVWLELLGWLGRLTVTLQGTDPLLLLLLLLSLLLSSRLRVLMAAMVLLTGSWLTTQLLSTAWMAATAAYDCFSCGWSSSCSSCGCCW
jgi:hypothetical protein